MLNTAVKAARKAGTLIARAAYDRDKLTVQKKRRNDFVSEVDRAAESAIIATLRESYPKHAILAEESGASGDSDHQWVIDPLDGTTNFLHGLPQYCVSIALRVKGQVTQGVVFDPNRDELFTASKGNGAFLNDRRIRVSPTRLLEDALIGTGFPFREPDDLDQYVRQFREMTQRAAGIRRPGAAALDLAYVACGRYDGFWEQGLAPWDMAAGSLLVREAGGIVSDFVGKDGYLESGRIIAATPGIFPEVVQVVSGTRLRL